MSEAHQAGCPRLQFWDGGDEVPCTCSHQTYPPRPKKDENGLYPCPHGKKQILREVGDWWMAGNWCCGEMEFARKSAAIRAANKWVTVWWGKEAKDGK